MSIDDQFMESAIKRIDRLTRFAWSGNEHFRAIQDTNELFDNHREVFDMASCYFKIARDANLAYVLFAITKTFCANETEDESSLNLLTDIVRECGQRFNYSFDIIEYESTLSEKYHFLRFNSIRHAYGIISQEIEDKKETLKRIKKLRNKYYAHMDLKKSQDYASFFENNPVSMDELDELLNLNFTICNCINRLLNDATVLHDVVKMGSLDKLAKYAEKGKESEKREMERLLKQLS